LLAAPADRIERGFRPRGRLTNFLGQRFAKDLLWPRAESTVHRKSEILTTRDSPARLLEPSAATNLASMSEDGPTFYEQLVALERAGTGFVLVTLVESLGSVPQDTGAKMLVTLQGRQFGTIGGGRVEARAIALAQELLEPTGANGGKPQFVNWSLRADAGMTCGGSVKLYFEPHPARGASWTIAVFGAGHVAQALVRVLVPLPCTITCYDSRTEWLDRLPRAGNLQAVHVAELTSTVDELPETAFVLCMTQGHKTDRPILLRALPRKFPFVGVIGSAAKAAILRRELIADGLAPDAAKRFVCPVGLDFGTNHPHEIAVSIAAQLLTVRDQLPHITEKRLAAEEFDQEETKKSTRVGSAE
jgi:xanthine dehydrogenase accessory factor